MSDLKAIWWEGFNTPYEYEKNPYDNGISYTEWSKTKKPGEKWNVSDEFATFTDGHRACWDHIKNFIAQTIYENEHGMTDKDYQVITGEKRRKWEEIEQHEHDEYLWPASRVIVNLEQLGLLNVERMREIIKKDPKFKTP